MLNTVRRAVYYKVDLVLKNEVEKCRSLLLKLVDLDCIYTSLVQILGCSESCIYLVAELLKALCYINNIRLILILDGNDNLLVLRKINPRTLECLVKSLIELLSNTKTLTCGLHLRSKAYVSASDFFK